MKRLNILLAALCICCAVVSQNKKVETFDKNTWHWAENTDKYQHIGIEDGFLVVANLQKNKKASDYQNTAKTYAKVPFRPNDNFKLTIKYSIANYYSTLHYIMFNTSKQCLEDYEETGQFDSYFLAFGGGTWGLALGDGQKHSDKMPGKVKAKGEYPMEFILTKNKRDVTIELNGIQLYEGNLEIYNPCIGFQVPLLDKKYSSIKIDEIIIEQADEDE